MPLSLVSTMQWSMLDFSASAILQPWHAWSLQRAPLRASLTWKWTCIMIFIKAYEALAPCQRRHHTEMKDPPVSEPELQTGTTSSLATISGYCSPIKKKKQHKNKLRKKNSPDIFRHTQKASDFIPRGLLLLKVLWSSSESQHPPLPNQKKSLYKHQYSGGGAWKSVIRW